MLFSSLQFIFCFLPLTFLVYNLLGRNEQKKYAILWLVIASLFFYGYWDIGYVPLLILSICFNYVIGKELEDNKNKTVLYTGITGNILLLGYFKYTDFFLSTANEIVGIDYFDLPHIILPLGISFFTFTQSAYLIDAYRGDTKNRSFLTYCEFVTIFPHLIAGPIINHKTMIPQFIADNTFRVNYENIARGITIFSFGLFKKVIIADGLSIWVNQVFNNGSNLSFTNAWIGALGYTLQLYFDFSGYSEMAIGLGLMFNLTFPVNFNSPYQANNIIDFWRRWHMTLGDWVKNYLYIPLGGNRHGELKKMRNLFTSMTIIGLWHGAGWTFVLWGALHGSYLMINHQWRRLKITIPTFVSRGVTFLAVIVAWVFFRASSVRSGMDVLKSMADVKSFVCDDSLEKLLIIVIITVLLMIVPNPMVIQKKFKPNNKWLILVSILMLISVMKVSLSGTGEFLYFQF